MNLDSHTPESPPPPSERFERNLQNLPSGHRSLPPSGSREFQGPQSDYPLPSYPSSTIHYYYPHSHAPYGSSSMNPPSSDPPSGGAFAVLPSVSQSRVPSLRRTPSVHSNYSPSQKQLASCSPFLAPNTLLDNSSCNSDHHSHVTARRHDLDNPSRTSHHSPIPDRHLDNISRTSQHF